MNSYATLHCPAKILNTGEMNVCHFQDFVKFAIMLLTVNKL